jgi:hypothetical protein
MHVRRSGLRSFELHGSRAGWVAHDGQHDFQRGRLVLDGTGDDLFEQRFLGNRRGVLRSRLSAGAGASAAHS